MAQPDPYQRWSGAPKHWVEIPEQRLGPPPVVASVTRPPARSRPPRAALVAALVVTAAVLLLTMAGSGSSVADLDRPPGTEAPTSR